MNVEIFAKNIFLHISHRAVDARKFDVSENYIIIIEQIELTGIFPKIKIREYAP